MNRTLLLDIDGVLIRDKNLISHVRDNCVRYVQTKFPSCKNPVETNRTLYLAYGHTARGLRDVHHIDVSDFNEHVYDRHLMDHLTEVIYSNEFQKEARDLHDLMHTGWSIALFTNAPIQWARPVARAISDRIYVSCVGSDLTALKPEPGAYMSFMNGGNHIYVDDSLKNLGPTRKMKHWNPVYFGDEYVEWCPTVSSISEICKLVKTNTFDIPNGIGASK